MKTLDDMWRDLEGYTPPNCPQCGQRATLDEEGYWCEPCSDPETPQPGVDDIANGSEFAEALTAYRKASAQPEP